MKKADKKVSKIGFFAFPVIFQSVSTLSDDGLRFMLKFWISFCFAASKEFQRVPKGWFDDSASSVWITGAIASALSVWAPVDFGIKVKSCQKKNCCQAFQDYFSRCKSYWLHRKPKGVSNKTCLGRFQDCGRGKN